MPPAIASAMLFKNAILAHLLDIPVPGWALMDKARPSWGRLLPAHNLLTAYLTDGLF
jgi:hypothetical protein